MYANGPDSQPAGAKVVGREKALATRWKIPESPNRNLTYGALASRSGGLPRCGNGVQKLCISRFTFIHKGSKVTPFSGKREL
jgi:hypothetical protein